MEAIVLELLHLHDHDLKIYDRENERMKRGAAFR